VSLGKDGESARYVRVRVKKIGQSKTWWFNVVALLIAVLVAVLGQFGYTGELPPEWAQYAVMLVTLINLILRLITKQPLEL